MCVIFSLLIFFFLAVLSMVRVSSVVMTALELRCSRETLSGAAPRIVGTTGASRHTRNHPEFQDSLTGSMMLSASTTAACGQTTANTTSLTARPVTAEHIVLLEPVKKMSVIIFFFYFIV